MSTPENAKKYYTPEWLIPSGIIDSEESFSSRVSECLDRYWHCVIRWKQEIKVTFSEKEFTAIVSAMLSHAWSRRADFLDREILINIEDSLPNEINLDTIEEKKTLEGKIKGLPYHLHVALAEAIREFWIENRKNEK